MKIIPQIAFTPHINEIPKKVLHSFQDAIVSVLWRNRPIWRAKMLVLGLFSSPHRCDPFIARAYNTILEVSAFLKSASSSCRQEWISFEQNQNISPNKSFCTFSSGLQVSEYLLPWKLFVLFLGMSTDFSSGTVEKRHKDSFAWISKAPVLCHCLQGCQERCFSLFRCSWFCHNDCKPGELTWISKLSITTLLGVILIISLWAVPSLGTVAHKNLSSSKRSYTMFREWWLTSRVYTSFRLLCRRGFLKHQQISPL